MLLLTYARIAASDITLAASELRALRSCLLLLLSCSRFRLRLLAAKQIQQPLGGFLRGGVTGGARDRSFRARFARWQRVEATVGQLGPAGGGRRALRWRCAADTVRARSAIDLVGLGEHELGLLPERLLGQVLG